MEIKFGELGSSLATRFNGLYIHNQIENSLRQNDFIIFDFSDVNFISHGFADECFGKLLNECKLEDLKKRSTFQNTNQLINRTIAFTFHERI